MSLDQTQPIDSILMSAIAEEAELLHSLGHSQESIAAVIRLGLIMGWFS